MSFVVLACETCAMQRWDEGKALVKEEDGNSTATHVETHRERRDLVVTTKSVYAIK